MIPLGNKFGCGIRMPAKGCMYMSVSFVPGTGITGYKWNQDYCKEGVSHKEWETIRN